MSTLVGAHSLYTDGGIVHSNPSRIAGTWAWCLVNSDGKRICTSSGLVLPEDVGGRAVSNNQSEFYAVLCALEGMPDGWTGDLHCDSRVTIRRFFMHGGLANIPDDWRRRGTLALHRLGTILPVLVSGHPTEDQLAAGIGRHGNLASEHNCWCDSECRRLAALAREAAS